MAQAILHAAAHPVKELTVGGAGGPLLGLVGAVAPWLARRMLNTPMLNGERLARTDVPDDNLHHPARDLRERTFHDHVHESSLVSTAQMRPKTTLTLVVAAGLAVGAVLGVLGLESQHPTDPQPGALKLALRGFGKTRVSP